MPLLSLPADKAFANLRRGRQVLWPDGRHDVQRLSGVATVGFEPSFQLEEGAAVLTIGSCFARNIETRLETLGFDVPARRVVLPEEERGSYVETELLNKYSPWSIVNELRWAFEPGHPFPAEGYLRVGEGLWHDPHLAPSVAPASLERIKERREMISALYRQLPRCAMVVLTMGLVEAWFDEVTGLYLNGAPPAAAVKQEPRRFRLDILSVAEVGEALEALHGLLKRYGRPDLKVLITVSPVPMRATFTGRDAITANTYSKSALRAAVEEYVLAHPEVDYFPSYEVVTHTLRNLAFTNDERHISPCVVDAIVDRVVAGYGRSVPSVRAAEAAESAYLDAASPEAAEETRQRLTEALKTNRYKAAVKLFAALDGPGEFEPGERGEFWFRYQYGRALLQCEKPVEAELQFNKALLADPNSAIAYYALGLARVQRHRRLQAEEAFRRAAELDPQNVLMHWRLAKEMIRNGRNQEAEQVLLAAQADHPDEERLKAALVECRRAETRALSEFDFGGTGGWRRFRTLLARLAGA